MSKKSPSIPSFLETIGIACALCTLSACATRQSAPPFYTPGALVSSASSPLAALADGSENLYIPRGEKGVDASVPLSQISAYSEYTYDSQRIGTPWTSGYRNRYVVRQGVTVP